MKAKIWTLAAIALATVAAWAVAGQEPPEVAVLDDCMKKRPAVTFPHQAHFELTECTTCHHKQEGLTIEALESGVEVKRCAVCHLNPEEKSTPDCTQMSIKRNPYHINCVNCHKESGSENAPTKCKDCHVKEEG